MEEALEQNRQRLLRMVHVRLDPMLQQRVDPSDVIQEAYLEAARRFEQYQRQRPMSLFLWLRFLVAQKLVHLHRQHCDVKARDVRREVGVVGFSEATSVRLAQLLVDSHSSPSSHVAKAEFTARVQQALETLTPLDREVLALRHFEQLTHAEVAESLGLTVDAARKRYLRALQRLATVLHPLIDQRQERGEP